MPEKGLVLWIEDDHGQFAPVVRRLLREGINTRLVRTLEEATQLIHGKGTEIGLIVCDNVVRSGLGNEERAWATDSDPGLAFLEAMRLEESITCPVLLLTFFPPSEERISVERLAELDIVVVDKHGCTLRGLVTKIGEALLGGAVAC